MPEHAPGPSAPVATTVGTRLGVLAAAVVVGSLAAPIATHTWQSTAVTGGIGLVAVVAVVVGCPGRLGRAGRPRTSAAPWSVLFAAITVLELGALVWGDRPTYPTVSWLLGPYFVEPVVRFAGYVGWVCAGWWLVRR